MLAETSNASIQPAFTDTSRWVAREGPHVATARPRTCSRATPRGRLGASAGGLDALGSFLTNMPPDSGMAFLVITHQHADRPSLLPELLARKTKMVVSEVISRTPIERDHVYLARPGFELEISGGVLHPEPIDPHDTPMAIDRVFRSLAADQREMAVGIVLSGTGTDGTLGLEAIKDQLGMVMVQDEATALHKGMPHSAIASRVVDYVLPAVQMPKQLLAYARGARPEAGEAPESLARSCSRSSRRDGSRLSPATRRRRSSGASSAGCISTISTASRGTRATLQANANEIDFLAKSC